MRVDTADRIIDAAEICLESIKEKGAITFLDMRDVLDSKGLTTSYTGHISKILQTGYGVKMDRIGTLRKKLGLTVSSKFQDRWKSKGLYYLNEEALKQWFLEHQ